MDMLIESSGSFYSLEVLGDLFAWGWERPRWIPWSPAANLFIGAWELWCGVRWIWDADDEARRDSPPHHDQIAADMHTHTHDMWLTNMHACMYMCMLAHACCGLTGWPRTQSPVDNQVILKYNSHRKSESWWLCVQYSKSTDEDTLPKFKSEWEFLGSASWGWKKSLSSPLQTPEGNIHN